MNNDEEKPTEQPDQAEKARADLAAQLAEYRRRHETQHPPRRMPVTLPSFIPGSGVTNNYSDRPLVTPQPGRPTLMQPPRTPASYAKQAPAPAPAPIRTVEDANAVISQIVAAKTKGEAVRQDLYDKFDQMVGMATSAPLIDQPTGGQRLGESSAPLSSRDDDELEAMQLQITFYEERHAAIDTALSFEGQGARREELLREQAEITKNVTDLRRAIRMRFT